jgi:hypothetical protein
MNFIKSLFKLFIPVALFCIVFTVQSFSTPLVNLSISNRSYDSGSSLYTFDVNAAVTGSWSVGSCEIIIGYNMNALLIEAGGSIDGIDLTGTQTTLPSSQYYLTQSNWGDGLIALNLAFTGSTITTVTSGFKIATLTLSVLDASLYGNLAFNIDDPPTGTDIYNSDAQLTLGTGSSNWNYTNPTDSIIQPPAACTNPDAPTGTATSSITSTGATISWNAVTGCKYSYQVSTSSAFTGATTVTVTGTSVDLTGLTAGTPYFWHVRSVRTTDPTCMSAWTTNVTFTTTSAPTPPAVPTNLAPNDVCTQPLSVTLTWNLVSSATSYDVQIGTGTAITVTTNSYNLSGLEYNTAYSWMVRATNQYGSSDWTAAATFTTKLPAIITGRAPSNNAVAVAPIATFMWDGVTAAVDYTLKVGVHGLTGTTDYTTTGTEYTPPTLQYNTEYDWTVTAHNGCTYSDVSATFSFTTMLAAPTNLAPTGTSVVTTPTLTWNTVSGADHYTVWLSTDASFATHTTFTPATNSQALTGLATGTTYHFQVMATNTAGNSSAWASASFTTNVPEILTIPQLVSPTNGSTNLPISNTFTWTESSTVDSYVIGFSYTESPFTGITALRGTPTTTSYTVGFPYYNTTYYWWVRAVKGSNISDWSDIWHFTTMQIPAPVLAAPADNATVTSLTPSLSWNPVTGGTGVLYEVKIMNGTEVVQSFNPQTSPLVVPDNLLGWGMTYTWQVRAYQTGYSENWSVVRTFTTPSIPTITLISPDNDASFNPNVNIGFSWSTVPAVSGYQLEIATDNTFGSIVKSATPGTGSYTLVGGLAQGSYYWHVRAVNGTVQGSWSSFRHFTVSQSEGMSVSMSAHFSECNSAISIYFGVPDPQNNPEWGLITSIISGSGNYLYSWTPTAGLNDPYILHPTLSRAPNSAPFPRTTYTLHVTDLQTGAEATGSFVLDLPASPVVVLGTPFINRLVTAAGVNLNDSIKTVNGVAQGTNKNNPFPGFTLIWNGENFHTVTPSAIPSATPGLGLKRFELTVHNNQSGCETQPIPFYIWSRSGGRSLGRGDEENLVFGSGSILAAYPSMPTSVLNIEASSYEKTNMQLIVLNLMGQEVKRINEYNQTDINEMLDVSNLSSGMYFLILRTDNGQVSTNFIKE